MAMGLTQASYCYFVVFTFKGLLLIVRTSFDEFFFIDLVKKLNDFYKNYLLHAFLKNGIYIYLVCIAFRQVFLYKWWHEVTEQASNSPYLINCPM